MQDQFKQIYSSFYIGSCRGIASKPFCNKVLLWPGAKIKYLGFLIPNDFTKQT